MAEKTIQSAWKTGRAMLLPAAGASFPGRHRSAGLKTSYLKFVVAVVVLGGLAASGRAAILLHDPFENDDLATGGVGAVNGGVVKITNNVNGTGTATEEFGLAKATSNGHNNRVGIRSQAFDAVGAAALGSFTVTWVIDAASINPDETNGGEGLQLMVHEGPGDHIVNGPTGAGNRIGIRIGGTNDGFTVRACNDGSAGLTHTLFQVTEAALGTNPFDQFEDGFTVSLTLNNTGWSFMTTGVTTAAVMGGSGLWTSANAAGIDDVSDLLDSDSYVAALAQQAAMGTSGGGVPRFVHADSLTVTATPVPEPATMGLVLLGGVGALLRQRRSRLRA